MLREKKSSKDGVIYARNKCGRPQAENVSSTASSRTIRKHSSVIEHVITKISTGSIENRKDQNSKDIIAQQASLIKQNKENFVVSAKKAGLKIVSKFDIKDVAALKAEMPIAQIRLLKRAFSDSFGFDIFGLEKSYDIIWEL